MSKISFFRSVENKHDVYRGKDCMKKFCESLREHAMKIIDFKKKKTISKIAAGIKWKYFYICKEKLKKKIFERQKYCKLRDYCYYTGEYRGAVHNICDLKHSAPKKFL